MDDLAYADLQAAACSLGKFNKKKSVYEKGPDCIESLKDIVRYLRRDGPAHEIRRALGRLQVLRTDLLPLLQYNSHHTELVAIVLRLIVDLTNPVVLLYEEEVPIEKHARNNYMEIISISQEYKVAFADVEIWKAFTAILKRILDLDSGLRGDDDNEVQEMILVIVRNILYAPPEQSDLQKPDDEVTLHDQVLWAMHLSEFTTLLTFMAIESSQHTYCLHVIEILHMMLREQDPTLLAKAGEINEIEEDAADLKVLREIETCKKQAQKHSPNAISRYPRFGGTFVYQNVKGIGDRDMIVHAAVPSPDTIDLDKSKKVRLRAKNRRPEEEKSLPRRSTLNVRRVLKAFVSEFLNEAFNEFMDVAKHRLSRNEHTTGDESHYFWAIRFFLAFNRSAVFDISSISIVTTKETFHFIQTQMDKYYEMCSGDKKKIGMWIKRLHIALRAYEELLKTIMAMDAHSEERVKTAARVLKGHVFYMPEYRDMVIHLLLNYNRNVANMAFLSTVAETVHIYLKMLEGFTKGRAHTVVREKGKRKNRKKAKNVAKSGKMSIGRMNSVWLEISPLLIDTLEGVDEIPENVVPFDAAIEMDMEQQKVRATVRIQEKLRERNLAEAVALYRAAREVWPEGDVFGSADAEPEEEFMSLRHLYFADLGGVADANAEGRQPTEDVEAPEGEDDEDDLDNGGDETEFEFTGFLKRFANFKVLAAYGILLANFQKNTPFVNHCAVKMLHRLAYDLKMTVMLHQASYFITFNRILTEAKINPNNPTLKELAAFAKFIIRSFVQIAPNNPLILIETLFWKTTRDAYEIQYGYGESEKPKGKNGWTEEENYELKLLYDTYKDQIPPGEDIVDVIQKHLLNENRTRRQVLMQMKHLEIIDTSWKSNKRAKRAGGTKRSRRELSPNDDSGDENNENERPASRSRYKRLRIDDSDSDDDQRITQQVVPRETDRFIRSNKTLKEDDLIQLTNLLRTLSANEDSKAWLRWVIDSVEMMVADWKENGDNEAVPLVPLMPDEHDACENEDFCSLLALLGYEPPQTHEEQYWRLPGTLPKDTLLSIVSTLNLALNDDINVDAFREQ